MRVNYEDDFRYSNGIAKGRRMTTRSIFPQASDAAASDSRNARPVPLAHSRVTVEMGVWFMLLAVTLFMRLASLGQTPLSNLEAQGALDSLAIIRGDAITVSNPLFTHLQSIAISLLGASDFYVRIVAVLAGIWLCMLPIMAREQMGRNRALVFAVILVLSPAIWYMSRVADGQLLAWTIAITTLLYLLRRNSVATAIGAGLLLACGRDAVNPLIIIAVAMLVMLISRETNTLERPRFTDVLLGIGVFLAASTLFLWRPSGLGDAFNGIATWPAAMRTAGDFSLLRVVSGFAVYEPLLLLSALFSISVLVVHQKFSRIDAIWVACIIGGLALVLVDQSRTVASLLPIIVGFAALASHVWVMTIESALEQRSDFLMSAVVIGVSIIMFVYAYLGLSAYAEQQQPASLFSILLGLIMIVGSGIVCTLLADWVTALRSIALAIGICLIAYTISTGYQLTQLRSDNPAEAYVTDATDDGARALVRTIETISLRAFGDSSTMQLQVLDVAPPALRWALRDQHGVTYVKQISGNVAALTPATTKPNGDTPFVGSSYRVTTGAALNELRCRNTAPQTSASNCLALVRWITRRTVDEKLTSRWILWLSSDTASRASGIQ